MYFHAPDIHRVLYVLDHLREQDARELCASAGVIHPSQLLDGYMDSLPRHAIAHVVSETPHDYPIAILGVVHTAAGRGEAHMVATPEFELIAFAVTKWVVDVMMPSLVEQGFRRIECRAMEANRAACQWLRFLGAQEECVLPDYGANGESFIQFAWRPENVRLA